MKLLPSIYLVSLYCSYILPAETPLPVLENCSISWENNGIDFTLTWSALGSLYDIAHPLMLTSVSDYGRYSQSLSAGRLHDLCTTDLNNLKRTVETRRTEFDKSWFLQKWHSQELKEIDALSMVLKLHKDKSFKDFLETIRKKNETIQTNKMHYQRNYFNPKEAILTQEF